MNLVFSEYVGSGRLRNRFDDIKKETEKKLILAISRSNTVRECFRSSFQNWLNSLKVIENGFFSSVPQEM